MKALGTCLQRGSVSEQFLSSRPPGQAVQTLALHNFQICFLSFFISSTLLLLSNYTPVESEIQHTINEKVKTEQLFLINKKLCDYSNLPKFLLVFDMAHIRDREFFDFLEVSFTMKNLIQKRIVRN